MHISNSAVCKGIYAFFLTFVLSQNSWGKSLILMISKALSLISKPMGQLTTQEVQIVQAIGFSLTVFRFRAAKAKSRYP